MQDDSLHERIKNLYRMLFEMATGNLAFRLDPGTKGDDLDKLAQLLNTLAAQFQLAVTKSGYIVPHYSFQSSTQLIFVLDLDFSVRSFNTEVPSMLGHRPEELFKASFEAVLSLQSEPLWQHLKSEIAHDQQYHHTVQLLFRTANRKVFPAFCTISRLLYTETLFISSITTNLSEITELNRAAVAMQKPSDAAVIQSLYDYILDNLEKPLPTLKELSVLFQTNEFKLKDGFRHFFKTSIYQFYNDQRLKRAHLLIQQTEFPLKAIALMCGFNDYPNFLKAFKKRFGYAPGSLSRTDRR